LPDLHFWPINEVIFLGSSVPHCCGTWIPNLGVSFPLEMLSAVINYQCDYPAMLLTEQQANQGLAHLGPLVL